MGKPDRLFLLIKSLTKTEKRHLKLGMSSFQSREKNYIRLFDAIDAQKTYDEKAIKKKFEKVPSFKRLPYIKIYLYEQILKKLRTYYDGQSSRIRLNNYLNDIEILFRKELYSDCYELVKKAKQFALKYERHAYLFSLISWEITLTWNLHDQEQIKQLQKKAAEEWQDITLESQELNELRKIHLETMFNMQTQGFARSEHEMSGIDKLSEHPVMKKLSGPQLTQLTRNAILVNIARLRGDFEEGYLLMKQRAFIWEQKPHLVQENLNNYIQNAIVLVVNGATLFKLKEAEEELQKLKKLCEINAGKVHVRNKFSIRMTEIRIRCKAGEYEMAAKLLPDMMQFAETNWTQLTLLNELQYYYSIFGVYFGNGDFDTAHTYLSKVINFPNPVNVNLQNQARIVNLILQYERKEFIYLGHLLGSTYRFLLKNKRIYETENIIIDFIKAAFRFTNSKDILKGLAEMKKKVMILQNQAFERNFMEQFPLIEWIDSKLQNRPLAEIIRERCQPTIVKEKKESA